MPIEGARVSLASVSSEGEDAMWEYQSYVNLLGNVIPIHACL